MSGTTGSPQEKKPMDEIENWNLDRSVTPYAAVRGMMVKRNGSYEYWDGNAGGSALDAFGRIRVAQPSAVFDNKNIGAMGVVGMQNYLVKAIVAHGSVTGGPFQVGEVITGGTSEARGTVTAVNAGSLTYSSQSPHLFQVSEVITGGTSGATATTTDIDNGAFLTYNQSESSVTLSTGTISGEIVRRQSWQYISYVPGKGHLIVMTGILGTGKTNTARRIGYFDNNDGLFFELNDTTFNVVRRTSTSGSVVNNKTAQSSWNLDKLDGTGLSGKTLDTTKTQIFIIDFQWLGGGRVRWGFDFGGEIIYCHEETYSNNLTVPYMKTPTLPIRYEIENTGIPASGSSDMKEICCSVASEGGHLPPGFEFSASNGVTTVAVTIRRPVFAIRLKGSFNGTANRRQVKFLRAEFFANTNAAKFEIVHVHNPISITATWTDVEDESGVEYSTDISALTAEELHIIDGPYVSQNKEGQTNVAEFSTFVNAHTFMSQNVDSDSSQMFVVYCTSMTGTCNAATALTWVEFD